MALRYGITLTDLAEADTDITKTDISDVPTITPPDSSGGWKLEYSLRGDYKMYHFWVAGSIESGGGVESYWTGRSDLTGDIGSGNPLLVTTEIGVPQSSTRLELDHTFPVSIYGGQACWQNAGNLVDGNSITFAVTAASTQLQQSTNLDLGLDGERIYYMGAGQGTHGFVSTPTLVENHYGNGYWNYVDGNVVPASGNGTYDMYTVDKCVSRFMNNIIIFGDNPVYKELVSANTWTIPGSGYHLDLTLNNNSNTVWSAAFIVNLIRKETVSNAI